VGFELYRGGSQHWYLGGYSLALAREFVLSQASSFRSASSLYTSQAQGSADLTLISTARS